MPDTFFTTSPHWGGYVVLYFFVGGIAGGCCFLAGLLWFFGRPEDRAAVRTGYQVALTGAVLSALLLTLDLTKPLRFWHMLLSSHGGAPLLKPWSPISFGAWLLVGFAGVALLGTLGGLGETRPRWRAAAFLARGLPGGLIAVLGGVLGLALAGYTGVLLAVTNRPLWADSTWLGALFLCSGVSTAAATLLLLGWRRRPAAWTDAWLLRFDRRVLALELIALVGFLWSLGAVARVWLGWNGILLLLGVVGAGIVAPVLLERRTEGRDAGRSGGGPSRPPAAGALPAALVLLGGLLLRWLLLSASSAIETTASRSALGGP